MLQLGLDFAQAGTLTLCAVNVGPCTATGAVIPPLCGPLLLPLPVPVILGLRIPGPPSPPNPPCQASDTQFLLLPIPPAIFGTSCRRSSCRCVRRRARQ